MEKQRVAAGWGVCALIGLVCLTGCVTPVPLMGDQTCETITHSPEPTGDTSGDTDQTGQ